MKGRPTGRRALRPDEEVRQQVDSVRRSEAETSACLICGSRTSDHAAEPHDAHERFARAFDPVQSLQTHNQWSERCLVAPKGIAATFYDICPVCQTQVANAYYRQTRCKVCHVVSWEKEHDRQKHAAILRTFQSYRSLAGLVPEHNRYAVECLYRPHGDMSGEYDECPVCDPSVERHLREAGMIQ